MWQQKLGASGKDRREGCFLHEKRLSSCPKPALGTVPGTSPRLPQQLGIRFPQENITAQNLWGFFLKSRIKEEQISSFEMHMKSNLQRPFLLGGERAFQSPPETRYPPPQGRIWT